MVFTFGPMTKFFNLGNVAKVGPIVVMSTDKLVRLLPHPRNTVAILSVTLLGIATLVKPEQP